MILYEPIDIYQAYKRASGKPYKLPKDFDAYMAKMNTANRDALITATNFFNTKWRNIDIDMFMECGWQLFKSFIYVKFFDKRIINLYISKDKAKKRNEEVEKRSIIESAKFIMRQPVRSLKDYARCRDGMSLICIDDYLKNKLDPVFFFYLIHSKLIIAEEHDWDRLGWIRENGRMLRMRVVSEYKFLQSVEQKINEKLGEYK